MTTEIRKSALDFNDVVRLSRQVRRSHKDEFRILLALPADLSESTWLDIRNAEETELIIFSIREDIIDLAMDVCYARYMERQEFKFTAHCAAAAWLQIIDWHYFRHDPGEDPSAYPPADIPNRNESWIQDEIPEPSPKDTWCRRELEVAEEEEACCSSALTVEGILNDGSEKVASESLTQCDSKLAESNESRGKTDESKDSRAEPSTSDSSKLAEMRMDSSPLVPMSSERGSGDLSKSSTTSKLRRQRNIFSQSTSGRSKQVLPPLERSSKTRQS